MTIISNYKCVITTEYTTAFLSIVGFYFVTTINMSNIFNHYIAINFHILAKAAAT
jgi:hypothetical protein